MEELEACFKVLLIQVIKKLQQLQICTNCHKNVVFSYTGDSLIITWLQNHYFQYNSHKGKITIQAWMLQNPSNSSCQLILSSQKKKKSGSNS